MIEAMYVKQTKNSDLKDFNKDLEDLLGCFEYTAEAILDDVKDITPSKPEEKYLFDKGDIEF